MVRNYLSNCEKSELCRKIVLDMFTCAVGVQNIRGTDYRSLPTRGIRLTIKEPIRQLRFVSCIPDV
jgi:hypothetical protein